MTTRRPKKAIRRLMLKGIARHLVENLHTASTDQLTLAARAYWERTNWPDEYPGIVPLVQRSESNRRRVEITFCERGEPDLTDYTGEG